MNRRTLLTTITGGLAAMITKLKGAPKPDPQGAVTIEELERRMLPTNELRVRETVCRDELMVESAKELTEVVNTLLEGGATDVDIRWVNIANAVTNPSRAYGYFLVTGTRSKTGRNLQKAGLKHV